jgi:hypothetical protein
MRDLMQNSEIDESEDMKRLRNNIKQLKDQI